MSTHREYEPFEMAENMEEDLGLFEAALHTRKLSLSTPAVAHVLTVLDGSNQQETTRGLASRVAARLAATTVETSAHASTAEIQAAAAQGSAGLVVVPVPCGEDISSLAAESLGSVFDGLLQSSPLPLLCVRDPLDEAALTQACGTLLVALARDDGPTLDALSWAFRLVAPGGRIVLVELADRDSLADAQRLLQGKDEAASVEQAVIGRAVASRLGALIAVAQRAGAQQGLAVEVEFRLGNPVQELISAAQTTGAGMVIVARPGDHTSAGYHVAQDLLLATRRPVLVI